MNHRVFVIKLHNYFTSFNLKKIKKNNLSNVNLTLIEYTSV
jgi:hypothetical protein